MESSFPTNLWCGPEKVLIYNDAYRVVLGAKHPRALGRPGPEVWSEIGTQIEPLFSAAARGDRAYAEDAHFVMERTDGPPGDAWFTFSLSPIRDDQGDILAFLNVASETTARVRAEAALRESRAEAEHAERRLRDIFVQTPAFLAVLRGPEHRFEFANAAYSNLVSGRPIVGRTVAEELTGDDWADLLHPDDRQRTRERWMHSLATGEPYEIEFRLRRAGTDEYRWHLSRASAQRDEHGAIIRWFGTNTDIEDRRRAEAELERLTREATEANRAKSDFLAAMSHELRAPLNAIGGYAQIIELGLRGPVTDEQRHDLISIQRSKNHLDALVSDVLNFAKAGSGRIDFRPERLEVAKLLETVLEMITPQAREKSMRLEWPDVDPALAIHADADRTRQILLNLAANALKFTAHLLTIPTP